MKRVLTVFAMILAFAFAAPAVDNPYNGYFVIGDPALLITNPTAIWNTVTLTGPGINNYSKVTIPPDSRLWLRSVSSTGTIVNGDAFITVDSCWGFYLAAFTITPDGLLVPADVRRMGSSQDCPGTDGQGNGSGGNGNNNGGNSGSGSNYSGQGQGSGANGGSGSGNSGGSSGQGSGSSGQGSGAGGVGNTGNSSGTGSGSGGNTSVGQGSGSSGQGSGAGGVGNTGNGSGSVSGRGGNG